MKRRRKLWSILVVCFMVLGVVAAGLPMTASAEGTTPPEPGKWAMHVSFDLKGGAWNPGEEIAPYDVTANIGESIDASEFKGKGITPVQEGYKFLGWNFVATDMDGNVVYNGEEDFWDFDKGWGYKAERPTEMNLKFIAKWEPEVGVIHVKYDLKGGAWNPGEEIAPYDIPAPVNVSIDPAEFKGKGIIPVKDGHTFRGWHYTETDMDGNVVWGEGEHFWAFDMTTWIRFPGVPLETNLTLIAVWDPVEEPEKSVMHVSYDLLGGKWKDGEKIADYDIEFEPGTDIPASEFKGKDTIPVRDGFVFDGWGWELTRMDDFVLSGGVDADWIFAFGWVYTEEDPRESNLKLIANWKPVKTPKEEPTKAEPGKVTPKTPKTGDNSPLALATLLLVGAGAATVGVARKSYLNK